MHVRSEIIEFTSPLFDKTPLTVDVIAVIVFHCLLPDRGTIVTCDVQHRFYDFRQDVSRIDGQQLDSLPIVHSNTGIGCTEVNANFDAHDCDAFQASAGITPMDRSKPSASIEPMPLMDSAIWTRRFPFASSTMIRSVSRIDAAPIKRTPCSSRDGGIRACPFASADFESSRPLLSR